MARVKIPVNGQLVDAERVDITSSTEPWTELKLSDGSVLKTKMVIGEAYRVIDAWTDDGEPMYVVRGQPVTITNSPDALKRKKH